MSPETIGRLFELRQQIVESGARLMTTEELDYEVAERKGRLLGD
jgi:ribosomal protein L29